MKILKTLLVLGGLAVGLHQAGATLISTHTSVGQTVTDNNASGIVSTFFNSSTSISSITNVRVNITMTGGFNGDLYAYLTHEGATAILLNRIGTTGSGTFGSSQDGMNVWFQDGVGAANVHTNVGNLGVGSTYGSDGRYASPTDLTAVNNASATRTLSGFNGQQAFGTWTLFVADLSGGAVSTLSSWDLEVSGVPEPVNVALMILCGCFIIGHCIKWMKRKPTAAA